MEALGQACEVRKAGQETEKADFVVCACVTGDELVRQHSGGASHVCEIGAVSSAVPHRDRECTRGGLRSAGYAGGATSDLCGERFGVAAQGVVANEECRVGRVKVDEGRRRVVAQPHVERPHVVAIGFADGVAEHDQEGAVASGHDTGHEKNPPGNVPSSSLSHLPEWEDEGTCVIRDFTKSPFSARFPSTDCSR
jgi:hypothetical protein